MADKTPIVLDGDFHAPLAAGDTLPGTAVRVSIDPGNAIDLGSDGGLLVAADAIAATFLKCSGLPHSPGMSVPTCQEMHDAITAALGSIPQDQFLKLVHFDPVTHTMTFVMAEGGQEFTVDLSDLVPIVVNAATGLSGDGTLAAPLALTTPEAVAPTASQGTALPTALIGDRTQLLAAPDGWMTINGKKLPYWN